MLVHVGGAREVQYKASNAQGTYLSQEVTEGPANKRSHGLGGQRVLVKRIIVCSPAGNSSTANLDGVAEEGALNSRILTESRLETALYGRRALWCEGAGRKARSGNNKEGKELHFGFFGLKTANNFKSVRRVVSRSRLRVEV